MCEYKNDFDPTSLFRLASFIYAQSSNGESESDTFLAFIENIMLLNKNTPISPNGIAEKCLSQYGFIITKEEVLVCLHSNGSTFRAIQDETSALFCLYDSVNDDLQKKCEMNIDYFITEYSSEMPSDKQQNFKAAIYQYLYRLTTSSISTYQKLLVIDSPMLESLKCIYTDDTLEAKERKWINDFLDWDNTEKNALIVNIVLCCLEYCLVVSGDHANDLASNYVKERTVFLDTNIIFRALGINGGFLQNIIRGFLRKCNQAYVHLVITKFTSREFLNTLKYYVNQAKQFPVGKIYKGAFQDLSDNSIIEYYYNWRTQNDGMSESYFWIQIKSSLESFINEFQIEDEKSSINIFSTEAQEIINAYDSGISKIKQRALSDSFMYLLNDGDSTGLNQHDAILTLAAETRSRRLSESDNMQECLIVTTDKSFQTWDFQRSKGKSQPAMIVSPDQLLSILIKVCGRSVDDIQSFIGFINIKPNSHQLAPQKANIILAG